MKKSVLECKYIFIAPPSIESLEARLRGRGTETEDKIQVRLQNATKELEYGRTTGNFDSIIVNNDLSIAVREIITVLQTWYPDHDLFD